MNINQIELGIMDFIQNEIASKATGLQKFLIYTGSFLGAGKMENLANKHQKLLKDLGIMTTDGAIDLDILYSAAKKGIEKSGKFEYKGIIFDETDVDKLYQYIKNRG